MLIGAALVVAYRRPRNVFGAPRGDTVRARGVAPALAAVLLVATLAGGLSLHSHAMANALVHGRTQPAVDDQLSAGALAYFRSRDGIPVVLAPYAATPADWYSGIAYELVGKAPVYAAAVSHYHSQAERKDSPAERRTDVDEFLDPATSQTRRHQILERWNVDTVALDLRTAAPGLVHALDADPTLRRAYTDSATTPPKFARLAVWTLRRPER